MQSGPGTTRPAPKRDPATNRQLDVVPRYCPGCGAFTWHDTWTVSFWHDRIACHDCGQERQFVEPFVPGRYPRA